MAELYSQELPQPETPEQAQAAPTGPPDYSAKRRKFLANFSALDPEAGIDEAGLGGILADDAKREEFTAYVSKLNPKFTMNGQQLADALGYDVKKKPGGNASGAGSPSTPSIDEERLNVNPDIMARELGIRPQDAPDQSFLNQNVTNPEMAAVLDPVQVAGGDARQYAPAFTGPLPTGTYARPSDKGTAAEGTQYVDALGQPVAAATEAPDVADDGFFASFGKSLFNGLDPKRVGGNLLDYGGDILEILGRTRSLGAGSAAGMSAADKPQTMEQLTAPLTDDKFSDTKAAELLAAAQAGDLLLSAAAQKSLLSDPSLASAGNMLGSSVASIIPVAAATAVGGPGAGAAVGGGLGISGTKDAARAAGISDDEATVMATVLAPIQGALEAVGVKDPGVAKLAVRATLREAVAASGGKLTQQAVAAAAKRVLPELTRRAAAGASHEALTEFLQGEAEGGAQLLADKLRGNESTAPGQGRYGVTLLDALVKSPIEQALVGGVLGGALGTTHGVAPQLAQSNVPAANSTQPIAGTKAIPADLPAADLRGRTVLVRDEQGNARLRQVHNILEKPEGRQLILQNAEGKLSSHPAGTVFINDANARSSGQAGNRITQVAANLLPTPSGLQALAQAAPVLVPTQPTTPTRTSATDPGPRADQNTRPTPPQAQSAEQHQPANAAPAEGPTLGELVPDEQPVNLSFGGEAVQALRNAEGDIELHHASGQVSVLDKGDQFQKPATDFLLTTPKIRVQAGDKLTLGSGEFATEQPIADLLRDKSGQITAVMVAGENGPRIIEADTPEGKVALADLNAREQQAASSISSVPLTNTAPTAAQESGPGTSQTNSAKPNTPAPANQVTGNLSVEQQKSGTAITYDATEGAAEGFARSLEDMAALAADVRAGKVDEKELTRRLPGVPTNTLGEAKQALRKGTLADMLDAAVARKRAQAPQGRTAEVVARERQQAEQELAGAQAELASPEFSTKLQRPTGPAALAGATEQRVALPPESLARKRTVQQARITELEQTVNKLHEEEQQSGLQAKTPAPSPAPGVASPAAQPQRAAKPTPANSPTTEIQAGQQLAADSPAAKRQAAIDNIKQRRAQQSAEPGVVEEYTQAYQLRDGEPESIRETGHQALQAAENAGRRAGGQLLPRVGSDNGGGSTLPSPANPAPQGYRGKAQISQSGISAELRQKGAASFVGRVINSIANIAEMAQVMRDPRWETFKYYFVKDLPDGTQQIVGERTMSARMPGTAPAFPAQGARPGQSPAQWLASEMQAVGATKYYAQHNHPSGYVMPSKADLEYTKFIAEQVSGFAGHVIINHGKYTVLTHEGGEIKTDANQLISARHQAMSDLFRGRGKGWPADPLNQPSKPGNLLGVPIKSADDVVSVAKAIEGGKDWVVLIGRGADGRVQGTAHLPLATLLPRRPGGKGIERARAAIRAFARETGSPHVILAGLPKPKSEAKGGYLKSADPEYMDLTLGDLVDLLYSKTILDAVQVDGKALSVRMFKADRPWEKRGWIGPTPAPRVWEQAAAYGISEDDLADFRAVLESYTEEGTASRKKLMARFREDVGSEAETGLSDEHLRELAKQTQQAAGLVPKAKPAKATKERRHATRYDEATRRSFTQDEARYTPVKQIENADTARAYVRQVGLENAYAVALDKPDGFSPAAHIEVQEAVAREYRRLSDEARTAGNQQEADEFWNRSKAVRAAKVSALTEAGQTLAQVQGFVADEPDSVLDLAIKETEKQRKPLLKKAEKAGAKVAAIAGRARREAMESTLKSEAVRKVREKVAAGEPAQPTTKPAAEPKGYGASNKYFTKATALSAREALRKLGLSTVVPPELVQFVGYHVEALARAGGNHSFAEVSKRVVRELGAKVRPLLPEAYERARKVYVRNGGDNGGFDSPEQIAQAIAPAAVQAGIKKLDTTLNRIAREHAEQGNQKGKTLAERFAAEAGIDAAQAQVYADAIEAEFAKQVAAKKTQLRTKLLTFSTRVLLGRQAATAVDKLLTTLNLATDPASAGELLKKQLNLPDITPAKADEFVKLAEAVRKARPGNERSDRVHDLMKALGKIEHVNKFDMAQATWYASVLSGPLTHLVNITSNAKEAIAENLISFLHTWADTGSLRAAGSSTRGAYKAQQRAFAEAAKIISTGYTGSQSEKFGNNNILENTTFKGATAPLNGLKYVGRALVGEDAYFNFTLRGMRSHELAMKTAYRELLRDASLAGEKLRGGELYERAYQHALGQLYGLPDLRAAAESQADAEALTGPARTRRIGQLVNEAVQQQQDKWTTIAESEGLTGVAKQQRVGELQEQAQPAELVDDAKRFAEIHTFNNGYEGRLGAMGALIAQLGEVPVGQSKPFKLLAPFARILTAVQNRRLEWAGLGFVRAIKGGTGPKDFQGGKFYREYTMEERERAFLRSTLGTVSALALYSLAKAGYVTITGSSFGDKDKEQENPNSSIKWKNGLYTSYKGDTMEIILAAIGNTLEWEHKQEKAGKTTDPAKRLAVITGLTTMYTLGMGPMKGVDDFNEAVAGMSKNPDKGLNYVTRFGANTAKGLLPYSAGVQQTLRGLGILAGQNQKETNSEPAWRSAYNSLVADVPWVRDGLEDAVDILGEPMKATSNRLWGYQPERSEADQAALDFLADHDLLPARSRITDDSLTGYDAKTGKLRPMTEKEFHAFQVARGKEFGRLLREAMQKPSDLPGLTPQQRDLIRQYDPEGDKALPDLPLKEARKVISDAHRQAVEVGKTAVFGGDVVPLPTK